MPPARSETETTRPAEALAAYVHDHAGDYVDFLCRLARAESPSTDPDAQQEVQHLMAEALTDLGFSVTPLPGTTTGGALYARPDSRTPGAPCQLLVGHGDTVWPTGTLDTMPVTLDGDRLRGPGVFDMKAGLTSIVFALRALAAHDLTPAVTPLVLVTSDEEIGSPESRPHIERLARVAERVYVLEPALGLDGKIKTARKGTGEMTLIVRPTEDGAGGNVVVELSQLVQRLYDLHEPERGVTINVGTIDGHQVDDETGTSYGQLVVDVRVPTHEAAEEVRAAIQGIEAHTPGVTLEVRGGIERPPLERTPGNRRLWRLARRRGRDLGLELEEGRAGGASDGNFTSQHTPTLDGLGAVGDGAHADHEFIHVGRTLDRCALLALLLLAPPLSRTAGADETQYSTRSS
jgi:glutamate carboxypeptidase